MRHPPTARIGVIDPYAVSRRGLEAALADSPLAGEVEVVLEPDAAAACRTILIEPHGLPFLRQHALNTRIRSDRPRLVLWSWDGDRYDVRHRFDGRLDKHHPTAALPAYFCDAVRQAEAGRRLPHGSHFFADWSSGVGSQAFHLTGREVDVLRLLGEGGTNAQIADDLGLSINSVKTYVRTAYSKIGAPRRSVAVRWAREHLTARVLTPAPDVDAPSPQGGYPARVGT